MTVIRPERPGDVPGIRAVNERAFGQPDEAALVDAVRARGERTISLVAVDGDRVVGHNREATVESLTRLDAEVSP